MSAAQLAPYAADETRNRRAGPIEEPAARYRGEYQRDRDRIIHSTAFRRLVYKTQVFVNHEGDLYRTRLTHSLEVAQIGRSVATALNLNEALTEAICLAHDLGHTPFGHAGQDVLNACMRDYGGFEHNLQSLRVVDELEAKYADFPGLNLMFETREGILKHCSKKNARELGELGERFLRRTQPGLEAQIADIADAIAYNNHDVDDGYRAGLLISLEQLREQPLFEVQYRMRYRQLSRARRPSPDLRDHPPHDQHGRDRPDRDDDAKHRSACAGIDRRGTGSRAMRLVAFSDEIGEQHQSLKSFLHRHLLQSRAEARDDPQGAGDARRAVRKRSWPTSTDARRVCLGGANRPDEAGRARVVADYIAGMTDRYAFAEHERISS